MREIFRDFKKERKGVNKTEKIEKTKHIKTTRTHAGKKERQKELREKEWRKSSIRKTNR